MVLLRPQTAFFALGIILGTITAAAHCSKFACSPSEVLRISQGVCHKLPDISFSSWRFSQPTLLQIFPVDAERRNYVRQVRNALFSLVSPTPLRRPPRAVAFSADALQLLDLSSGIATQDQLFLDVAAGNSLVADSQPFAHRYGGHQFGSWSGQLGDGRAHYLGQYVNRYSDPWEVQLKGSGRTPYSRHGDGRAVLRSSVREFLASEAMYHLGIPTSRAASLVVSNDPIMRDKFYDGHPEREPAGVVMRLAPSWFRIGSLELMHVNREFDTLKSTVDFVIDHYFPSLKHSQDKYLDFFSAVVDATTAMVAQWQGVGFAHGVCNTDNFSLLSLTIDYGPFGFLDKYDPSFVPNTSDDEGLYQFQRQPEAAKFNLRQLWTAMGTLFNDSRRSFAVLSKFDNIFHEKYVVVMRRKLGLLGEEDGDWRLVVQLLDMMQTMFADHTMSWRELSEISKADLLESNFSEEMWALPKLSEHDEWPAWRVAYIQRLDKQVDSHDDTDDLRRQRMISTNPRYVLRNYMAENAIRRAASGHYSEVQKLHKVLQEPFQRQEIAEHSGYASPPPGWSRHLRVSCSS